MKKTFIRTLSVLAIATLTMGGCKIKVVDSNQFKFFNSLEETKLLTFDNLEEIKEEDAEPIIEALLKETQSVNIKAEVSGQFMSEETEMSQKVKGDITFYQDEYFERNMEYDVDIYMLGTKLPPLYSGTQNAKGIKLSGHILSVEETKLENEDVVNYAWNKQTISDPEIDVRTYNMEGMLEELMYANPVGKMVTKGAEYWVLMDYDRDTESATNYAGESFRYQEVELYQAVLEVKDGKMTRGQVFTQVTVDKDLNNGQFLDEPKVVSKNFEYFEIKYGELTKSANRDSFVASIPDYAIQSSNTYVHGYLSSLSMTSNGVIASVENTVEANQEVKRHWLDETHFIMDVEFELAAVSDAIGFQLNLNSVFSPLNSNGTDYIPANVDLLEKLADALGGQYQMRTYNSVPYLVLPGNTTQLSFSLVVPVGDTTLNNVEFRNVAIA